MRLAGALSALIAFAGTDAFAVSVTPDVPEAYEPFSLRIYVPSIPGRGMAVRPMILSDSDNELLIGYQIPRGAAFLLPGSFPIEVNIPGLPPGTYSVRSAYLPDLAHGAIEVQETELNFSVAEAPPTETVHAFFNGYIDHYFITSWEDEAQGLITADDGWELADFGFRAWPAFEDAPSAAVPVCRFYSSQVNSHFYTGDDEECTRLREEDHGWEYEGIAFQALIPTAGACPAGTEPVWRLYNNRFAELDSNHRFVASKKTYLAMVADGWLGEGIAFCSPE